MIDIDNFHLMSKAFKQYIFNEHPEDLLELIKPRMKEKRYLHSLSVADVAVSLARSHHLDLRKAYLAGILHDITKSLSIDEHRVYFLYYDRDKIDVPEPIMHSYSAKYYIKEKLNLYDGDILEAIYHHTDGASNTRLTKILYIADKREPLRGIHDQILDRAYHDLDRAYEELKEDVKEYLKRNERSRISSEDIR